MKVKFISTNSDGNYYVGYLVDVPRGIRGKSKGHVEELLIVGMHHSKFKQWLKNNLDDMDFTPPD